MSLPSVYLLHFMESKKQPRQDFIGQGHDGKVKSRSHHDDAHLHLLTNVPTKYQLATPYRFQYKAWTRFYRSRSLRQSQRSNQGHTMTWQTYNIPPMSLSRINFLHLTVSEISPGQDFIGHYAKVKGQIKVRP